MINFGILGQVTASRDAWTASLTRQQQHLLAVLVLAARPAAGPTGPAAGVTRDASRLPAKPARAFRDAGGPDHGAHGAFRDVRTAGQADVVGFRARLADARKAAPGPRSAELMHAARREWGPDGTGLY